MGVEPLRHRAKTTYNFTPNPDLSWAVWFFAGFQRHALHAQRAEFGKDETTIVEFLSVAPTEALFQARSRLTHFPLSF
jgi:hypothetical protein